MGADSNIGIGTLLMEKRDLSLVGIQKPDANETTEVVVATYPRRRDNRSRQAVCVPTTTMINPIVVLAGIRRYPKLVGECL
jgi:hypothetical protein